MSDRTSIGAAGEDSEVGIHVVVRILIEGNCSFIDTIALMSQRSHFVVLPTMLLAVDIDDGTYNIDIIMPRIFTNEAEYDAAISRIVSNLVVSANGLEVIVVVIVVENHLEGTHSRCDEATGRGGTFVTLVHTGHIDTGTCIAAGKVSTVLHLDGSHEGTVILTCHGIKGVRRSIVSSVALCIKQVALDIIATAKSRIVQNGLAVVAGLFVCEIACIIVVEDFVTHYSKGITEVRIALDILICLFDAIVTQSPEFFVCIVAVKDGVELVVNFLDNSQLILQRSLICLGNKSFDFIDVAPAVEHCHLFLLTPLECIETLAEVIHHSNDSSLAMTTINQFELTPHGHTALVPGLAGVANTDAEFATLNDAIYIIYITATTKCEADSLALFGHIAVTRIIVLSRGCLTVVRSIGIARSIVATIDTIDGIGIKYATGIDVHDGSIVVVDEEVGRHIVIAIYITCAITTGTIEGRSLQLVDAVRNVSNDILRNTEGGVPSSGNGIDIGEASIGAEVVAVRALISSHGFPVLEVAVFVEGSVLNNVADIRTLADAGHDGIFKQ